MKPVYLQLYSMREEMAKDCIGTIKKVAKMGYQGVEFAGFPDIPAVELRIVLDDLGLKTIGSHFGFNDLNNELQRNLDYMAALGGKYVVLAYYMTENSDDAKKAGDFMAGVANVSKKQGFQTCYHNHAHELKKENGKYLLETLLETAGGDVYSQLDVYWVEYAGVDTYKYIESLGRKLLVIHAKEIACAPDRRNVEIGKGYFDWKKLIMLSRNVGVEDFIVEQEEYTLTPAEECENDYNYLASIDA